MTCPTCGCATHTQPQTWRVTCSVCQQDKWPHAVERPAEPYVCTLCRLTPPGTRQARQRAGVATQARRRAQRAQPSAGGA